MTVELWVRSLSPGGAGRARSAAIRRLEALEDAGRVDGFRVRVWGERIGRSTPEARTERGRTVLDRVAAFRVWADDHGLSLSPAFEERSRGESIAGDGPDRVVTLPEVAVAEYRGGELAWVTPCSDGDRTYTAREHLAALDADPADGGGARPDPAADRGDRAARPRFLEPVGDRSGR